MKVAIATGDPAGIGPEISRKAAHDPRVLKICEPVLVNSSLSSKEIKIGKIQPWAQQIRQLAQNDNVVCKLSGLVTEADLHNWKAQDLRPYLDVVFDAFGPERWTDITNSLAKAIYRQRVTHFTEELSFLSESDKDWVMGRAILEKLKWA